METNLTEQKLVVTDESISSLNKMRKWTMFFAILGFIFLGFLVIFGFLIGTIFSNFYGADFPFPNYIFGIIYLLLATVYFFPMLFLYRFSINAKKSVESLDSDKLNVALKNLKAHFQYIGILTIIFIGIYILIGIIAIIGASFFSSF